MKDLNREELITLIRMHKPSNELLGYYPELLDHVIRSNQEDPYKSFVDWDISLLPDIELVLILDIVRDETKSIIKKQISDKLIDVIKLIDSSECGKPYKLMEKYWIVKDKHMPDGIKRECGMDYWREQPNSYILKTINNISEECDL
jgi:hypothetical protein